MPPSFMPPSFMPPFIVPPFIVPPFIVPPFIVPPFIVPRPVWLIAALVFAATVAIGGALMHDRLPQFLQPRSATGGPFELIDTSGRAFTEKDLLGKPVAMVFGFTNCPDVCPTTLQEMSNWLRELGSDAGRAHFVFVTVDPSRDTPAAVADYMAAFDTRIVGLTGSEAAVARMRNAYGVYAHKVALDDDSYTMDHATQIYLFDRRGHFVDIIRFGEATAGALMKLRKLIAADRSVDAAGSNAR